jgi:alpha-amylase
MTMKKIASLIILIAFMVGCNVQPTYKVAKKDVPFIWENANVYFLLTDRFCNGNTENDINFNRNLPTGPERGFQGGDFAGIIQKLKEGYFTHLGVSALWFSPVFEQIHGGVDEGTGFTYAYHGYWIKDWTNFEPNFGTEEEFAEIVDLAHSQGIRVLMDIIINHTGPVTDADPYWGSEWARTGPNCTHKNYEGTVPCTLVDNLPDVLTESNKEVELPQFLIDKWEKEGTLEKELESLEAFFAATAYSKSPRFYIIKWLIDFIKKFGVDGFRIDTAKHTEASLWAELDKEAKKAFAEWKAANPDKVLDDNEFYLTGEVYNYGISSGQNFDNGGINVNYFKEGDMQSLINFEFKWNAKEMDYEALFSKYSKILNNELADYSVLNYITSHDDGQPFDKERLRTIEGGTKLLLTPGKSQIYYGDESIRNLIIKETQGDATLRGFMNWDQIDENPAINNVYVQDVLSHYQKLGKFRNQNPSVGAGVHTMLSKEPYVFKREFEKDAYSNKVLVGLELPLGEKEIETHGVFANGDLLTDYYSGQQVKVKNGKVRIDSEFAMVLLGL